MLLGFDCYLLMETMIPNGGGLFQQHNANLHACIALQHCNWFKLMTWPTNSPDLNPIERLQDLPEKQVQSIEAQPHIL